MRKKLTALFSLGIMVTTSIQPVLASSEAHYYNEMTVRNNSWFDGMLCTITIPTINDGWKLGSQNSVHYEFWYNIDGGTGDWVEGGYSQGTAWTNMTSFTKIDPYNYYKGLFISEMKNGTTPTFTTRTYSYLNWSNGQTHTMGCVQNANSTDMRFDESILYEYTNTSIGSSGTYGADYLANGIEWVTGDTNPTYSISGSPVITNLNAHNSSGWHLWSEDTVYQYMDENNTPYYLPYLQAVYDRTNGHNEIDFLRN